MLWAIREAKIPLVPPDDDVEDYSPKTDAIPKPQRNDSVFVSHTAVNEPLIRAMILPAIQPFFGDIFLMNIGMAIGENQNSLNIVEAYKRRILTALWVSGWVVVVVSAAAASSRWVKFEFAWALQHHSHRRIVALILDESGRRAFLPLLPFVRTLEIDENCRSTTSQIARVLHRSGARERRQT